MIMIMIMIMNKIMIMIMTMITSTITVTIMTKIITLGLRPQASGLRLRASARVLISGADVDSFECLFWWFVSNVLARVLISVADVISF